MSIDYLSGCHPYVPSPRMKKWMEESLPGVYDESLSLYELMAKLLRYFGDTIENVDKLGETSNSSLLAFTQLRAVVDEILADIGNGVGVEVDASLTIEGMAADAMATGNELKKKVDVTGVNTAVETALARAKANGDFKGDKGDKGDSITIVSSGVFVYPDAIDHPVTRILFSDGTSVDIPHGKKGDRGAQGVKGDTPVKGVDYCTEDDKQEMVDAVLAALPTWNGGEY